MRKEAVVDKKKEQRRQVKHTRTLLMYTVRWACVCIALPVVV